MSGVNITVLEGGKAENFGQVTKLRTDNGDGHDLWVPKVDVQTKSLSVKKNGLYYTKEYTPTASEKKDGHAYDIYGWDTITVSVKKKVKGKKKKIDPSTGLDYDVPTTVSVDDDGNLVEEEMPTSIKIVKEPDTTVYVDGYNISIAGIRVKAYLEDDSEWGDVPFNELSFEPTVAHLDSHPTYTTPLDDSSAFYQQTGRQFSFTKLPIGTVIHGNSEGRSYTLSQGSYVFAVQCLNPNDNYEYIWLSSPDAFTLHYKGDGGEEDIYHPVVSTRGFALADIQALKGSNSITPYQDVYQYSYYAQEDMVKFGTGSVDPKNEITVTWDNDDLDEPLTDKYEIIVVPAPVSN